MASELKPWKYEIKYGPEGEDAYSWVYDDHGAMVATMKTHKAKEVVDRMNTPVAPVSPDATGEPWPYQKTFNAIAAATRLEGGCIFISVKDFVEAFGPTPDATGKCGELVTVGNISEACLLELKQMLCGEIHPCNDIGDITDADIELVTRSQAVELLAAERAKYRDAMEKLVDSQRETLVWQQQAIDLKAELDFVGRVKGVNEKYANALAFLEMTENDDPEEFAECFWNKFIQLEADNAALTARIEEWEKADRLVAAALWEKKVEDLEAKLSAAEKALEPFAAVLEDYDPDWEGDDVTAVLVVGSVTHYGITLGDFRQARAALGGKPS